MYVSTAIVLKIVTENNMSRGSKGQRGSDIHLMYLVLITGHAN